jgi:glycosyltransferase involved in cell wall biosynthesis
MELSVVIRCKDDERVFDCINSIDEDVEIIVVLNENDIFKHKLEQMGVSCCVSPPENLSTVSNIGFLAAKADKVIITDSDTIFYPGCIKKMDDALNDHKVVRAKLLFRSCKDIRFSDIVSEARDFVNSLPLVYTPGIAVRKDILPEVGGFLFNENVPFAVDADLNYRINKAGLDVSFLSDAIIQHDCEVLKHDLKAARRIGRGCRKSAESLGKYYNNSDENAIGKYLKGVKTRHYPDLIRDKGIKVFLYQIVWDFNFYFGYNCQRLGL